MNVYIKSFARPYYLDKCLQSIQKYAAGSFNIIVMDDGTDMRYLHRIQEKYPEVQLLKSPLYNEKVAQISDYIEGFTPSLKLSTIPFEFWKNTVNSSSPYLLLLEDDMWLTSHINFDEIECSMEELDLSMIKTTNFQNPLLQSYNGGNLTDNIIEIRPNLKFYNSFLFKKIFAQNFFKLHSILGKAQLISANNFMPVYAIYMVAGAFYEKKYYDYIWSDYSSEVNENYQLANVISWTKAHPEKRYGILGSNHLNTSFTSSATNAFIDIPFDPFVYNSILNEAWLKNELDIENDDSDINSTAIERVLRQANHPKASVENWSKWVHRFKGQYQNVGFNI